MTTGRGPAFAAALAALPSQDLRLREGRMRFDALYRELIAAATPPNPQFERTRIIEQTVNPRELVFLLGCLSEGENEALLLLDLAVTVRSTDPAAQIAHLIDEAWYYLRTSIDPAWQIEAEAPCPSAALIYLFTVLDRRLNRLRAAPPRSPDNDVVPDAAPLLRSLRTAVASASA